QDAAQRLRARRKAEGSLDFDLTEPELIYREGDLQAVVAFEAHEAHHIIEEFMVAANEAVARYLSSRGVPLVFRVHPRPALEDLGQLRRLLGAFGFSLPEPQNILSRDLQNILEKARGRPEEKFLMLQVLKSLRLAAYSEENRGHYGLARTHYTHFTSPIRRYPDLIVHRILKNTLGLDGGDVPDLASLSRHCSLRERAAEEAERDLVEWRIYRFLKRRCGEDFDGIIVDINRAGLVVELDGYFVDGLVAFSDLGGDYFFRESERRLVGRRSGRSFELGTRVRVSIASVDPLLRRMRFLLAEPAERKRPS
ncbi:MAG: RNB domain-containing ribonuclease, partial [Candidatus Aminicenantales bacterium]